MSQLQIKEGIVIDEVEMVVGVIHNLTGKQIEPDIIKTFVLSEKSTMFYIDEKLNSYMNLDPSARYLWLDTGFLDHQGKSIFISLHKSYDGFAGHITGNASLLIRSLKERHGKHKKQISDNANRFLNKHNTKAAERKHRFIQNIDTYYIDKCNEDGEAGFENEFAKQFKNLDVTFAKEQEISVSEEVLEKQGSSESVAQLGSVSDVTKSSDEGLFIDDLSDEDKDLTISLLLDQMDKMKEEMSEMLKIIEENKKDKELIESLREDIEQYEQTLTNIRIFDAQQLQEQREREQKRQNKAGLNAHKLLGKNKKILILGDVQIRKEDIQGICKDFGFNKRDIEFELDYKRVVGAGNRFFRSNRFEAVIFGKVPHKVAQMGDWSSCIECMKQDEFGPYPVDARTKSGELNVTKTSFKEALMNICNHLGNQMVVAC